jgi:hypothetical protein
MEHGRGGAAQIRILLAFLEILLGAFDDLRCRVALVAGRLVAFVRQRE